MLKGIVNKENENFFKFYENVFTNTNFVFKDILDEFYLKEDFFKTRKNLFRGKGKNENDNNDWVNDERLKVIKLKNSFIKYIIFNKKINDSMSILVTYYEKLTANFLNKIFVDLKKFTLQDKVIESFQKRSDDYEKTLTLYLEIIQELKKEKSKIPPSPFKTNNNNNVKIMFINNVKSPNRDVRECPVSPNPNRDVREGSVSPMLSPISRGKEEFSSRNDKNNIQELDVDFIKNELNLYKSYLDNLKLDNSNLLLEKKSINDAITEYTEMSSNINKTEISNLKTAFKIMEVYYIIKKEFYEEEIIKKNEVIDKLSEFSNEVLFR